MTTPHLIESTIRLQADQDPGRADPDPGPAHRAGATADGKARGGTTPVGSLFYGPAHGVFQVSFFEPGDDHGAAGVGQAALYYDSEDGRRLGTKLPWVGTAADIFVQMQFPMHSGRILGLPGRILISAMGLVVAALSVTGVVIWWRKRRARVKVRGTTEARSNTRLAPAA